MMRVIKWLIYNAIFAFFIIAGFVYNIEGARNGAIFLIWFQFFISIFLQTDECLKHLKEKGRAVPAFLTTCSDTVLLGILVWFGAWFSSIAFLLAMLLSHTAYDKAKSLADDKQ